MGQKLTSESIFQTFGKSEIRETFCQQALYDTETNKTKEIEKGFRANSAHRGPGPARVAQHGRAGQHTWRSPGRERIFPKGPQLFV